MSDTPAWLDDAHARASEAMVEAERAGLDPHDSLMHGLEAAFRLREPWKHEHKGMMVSVSGMLAHLKRRSRAGRGLVELMVGHLMELRADPTRADEFFQLYVDLPSEKP